ncbi:MAG TPA: alpha/beta fold hydrolase [Polyangiaceae bacterium]|nr:alpha/beta fold hydrolase [Polyangiaceae bacterium]
MRASCVLLALSLSGCGAYRAFVYPAPEGATRALGVPFEPLAGCAHDGVPVHGYYLPAPDAEAPVIVLFHGNGETMENRADLALAMHRRGFGAALVEYRGYGASRRAPPPDERGLYLDAAASIEALVARGIGPDRIVLLGISLGTGVAAQMAACGAARALVLVSPFTSLSAEAHYVAPLLPTGWLVPDRFDTLAKAPSIRVPTLVVHGDADPLVPFDMGRRLAAAIPHAELYVVHGGHHNDLLRVWRTPILDAVAAFVRR